MVADINGWRLTLDADIANVFHVVVHGIPQLVVYLLTGRCNDVIREVFKKKNFSGWGYQITYTVLCGYIGLRLGLGLEYYCYLFVFNGVVVDSVVLQIQGGTRGRVSRLLSQKRRVLLVHLLP